MHYVGVDLAWGERKPTGVAVVDDAGRLLLLGAATDDDDIVDLLGEHVHGRCLVAIDAPLIVTNPTGNRPCEAALNQDFGRFEAGAHPSNTGKPELAQGSRGARLARRLGLDIDPGSTASRRAIEVYPHPATIALFGLGRTLKYKNRPGRTVEELQEALLSLVGHVEGLASRDPRSRRERARRLVGAGRRGALRRPARHSCAWPRTRWTPCSARTWRCSARDAPSDTTTYGDGVTGYIVTPTLPEGQAPSPRRPVSRVPTAVKAYAAALPGRPGRHRGLPRARDRAARRGRDQLPQRDGPGQGGAVVRGKGGTHRRWPAAAPRAAARHHRPDRPAGHHLPAAATSMLWRGCRGGAGGDRRPRHGQGDRSGGQVRLRQPSPAGAAARARPPPGDRRPGRASAGAHGAAARLGGVRARDPLQGRRACRARSRPRPPVHACRGPARAGRPGVLGDPRAPPASRGHGPTRSPRRRRGWPRTTSRSS